MAVSNAGIVEIVVDPEGAPTVIPIGDLDFGVRVDEVWTLIDLIDAAAEPPAAGARGYRTRPIALTRTPGMAVRRRHVLGTSHSRAGRYFVLTGSRRPAWTTDWTFEDALRRCASQSPIAVGRPLGVPGWARVAARSSITRASYWPNQPPASWRCRSTKNRVVPTISSLDRVPPTGAHPRDSVHNKLTVVCAHSGRNLCVTGK